MQKVYCKHYTHAHVQTYKHTRIDASLHHTTLQDIDIALHDGKVRYITLLSMQKKTIHQIRYVTLRSKTVHYSTYVHPKLQYITYTQTFIPFHFATLHIIPLHCIAMHCVTLHYKYINHILYMPYIHYSAVH